MTSDPQARASIRASEDREKETRDREKDIKLYLSGLNSKIDHYISTNNKAIRTMLLCMVGYLFTALVAIVVYIWQTKT